MAQITVRHRFIHQAPRKLRLIGDMVRGLPADRAAAELATVHQVASVAVRKAILSAIAAARQQGLTAELFIAQVMVNEGPKLRRFIPMSRGRSQRILKRMSHLTVGVTDEPITIASSKVYKGELQLKPSAKSTTAKKTKKAETKPASVAPTAETAAVEAPQSVTEGSK